MDTETKEKLTDQQHQIEMLRTDMEANMRTVKAESNETLAKNEAAIDRLVASNAAAIGRLVASNAEYRADNDKLRADMEKSFNAHTTKMMIFIGVAIGVLTLILKFL